MDEVYSAMKDEAGKRFALLEDEKKRLMEELDKAVRSFEEKNRLTERQLKEIDELKEELRRLAEKLTEKNHEIRELENEIEKAKAEIERLKSEIDRAVGRISDLEDRIAKKEREIAELQATLEDKEDRIDDLNSQLEGREVKQTYKAVKGDLVDELLAKYINLANCPVPIKRLGGGYYLFGTRKIYAKILNDRLVIRVGGGYMIAEEFIATYAEQELIKLQKLLEKEGVTEYEDLEFVQANMSPGSRRSDKQRSK